MTGLTIMGSIFNRVTRTGSHIFGFFGFFQLGDSTKVKHRHEAIHLLTKIKPAMCCLLYLNRHI